MLKPPLSPPLNIGAPITDLERLWLETSCAYACFNETIMGDEDWDQLAVELWRRREELSPYFTHALRLGWPLFGDSGEEGENPLKTAMGINWEKGLPAVVVEGYFKDAEARVSRWRSRIRWIVEYARMQPGGVILKGDPCR